MTTDRATAISPKLVQLLLIALGSGSADGERINAIRAIQRQPGFDSHDLVAKLSASPIDEAEMAKIYNAGYQQRCADEAEQRRQAMVAVTSPFADGDVPGSLSNDAVTAVTVSPTGAQP